jgi:arginine utilization protein RocB
MADNQNTGNTGTADIQYNIISVLYHALQAAETIDKYIQDAQQGGNQDAVQFFQEVKQENTRRADRAKQLLGQMLGGTQSQSATR